MPDQPTGEETADRLHREALARRAEIAANRLRRESEARHLKELEARETGELQAIIARLRRELEILAREGEVEPILAQFWRHRLVVIESAEPSGDSDSWVERIAKLEREGTRGRDLFLLGVPGASDPRDGANEADSIPVSIYLADEGVQEQVEIAVEQWLATADVSIDTRGEPIIGSWFRLMAASLKRAVKTPAAREALLTAAHVADSRLVQAPDAYVTATLLQNVGPVLQALQPTKDAVVRAGALLIVKVDWVVQVYQLTAIQQAILDHRPHLAASPKEIIAALGSPEPGSQEAALQPAAQQVSTGTTATTAAN